MAVRTPQLALLVDQLMPATQAKPPMLAGNVIAVCVVASSFLRVGIGFYLASHLLGSPKLFLQFAVIHLNQRRTAVRAGVGLGQGPKTLNRFLRFFPADRAV